jgi:acyl-CoA synthetase (NDP forming)
VTEALQPLLAPGSVAVIGASGRPGRPGYAVLDCLRQIGFAGNVYPVTPSYEEILEWPCLPDVAEVPEAFDLAVVGGASERLESSLTGAIEAGARSALVFGRADDLERVRGIAEDAGIPLLGPATMGYVNSRGRSSITWMPPVNTEPGSIAVIAQSGTIFLEANTSDARLGFSLTVHPGQEAVVDAAQLIEYALGLPETRVLGLYLETVTRPDAFEQALALAETRGVPVVAIRAGRTGRSAAQIETHAGRLAGGYAAFEALFRRYGVAFAHSMDEFWTTLACFAHPRPFAPGGVAALLDSGGERALLLDHADEDQVGLAELSDTTQKRLATLLGPNLSTQNPLDIWDGHPDMQGHATDCLRVVVEDDAVSAALVFCDYGATDTDPPNGFPEALADSCRTVSAETDKPIFAATYSSRQLSPGTMIRLARDGIQTLDGMQMALLAAKHAQAYRDRPQWGEPLTAGPVEPAADPLAFLRSAGLPVVESIEAADEESAAAAAAAHGYPVVLKTNEEIAHKSDVDGVLVDLATEDALRAGYRDFAERLGPRVTVAPLVRGDVELALGIVGDQFGPMLMVSAGGTLVELLDDRAWLLAPASAEEIEFALGGLRVARVLAGVRGKQPCDVAGFCELASRLSSVAFELRDSIQEIDVNPVIVGPDGCTIVDALIVSRVGHENLT